MDTVNDFGLMTILTNNTPLAREARPWTRWWWMGNALTEAEISRHLQFFREAGFGGVEVSPIYGPRGSEDRFVTFLSPRWVDLFTHTMREAERLDMGVDLICGTGWPFGGPWVKDVDAAKHIWVESFGPGEAVVSKKKATARVLAEQVQTNGARIALFLAPTAQQVKRAAPGGEGNVLDHFDATAVRHYVAAFDAALDHLPDGLRPRCFFNDSWEVFGANAPADIREQFSTRRGYDICDHLAAFGGDGDAETVQRVRSDFRQTIHDLTAEAFLGVWTTWARKRGSLARNQAHGSPGNLLDLYAAADIPETEMFGPIRLRLHGMTALAEVTPDFGDAEEPLLCRMAPSAAHVTGKRLCSSESFTWAGEHGHIPLEHLKAEVDTLLALGINHIFYHGTPFSPSDVEWPGWLFYASTLAAPTNPFWRDLPALNAYIGRCQTALQQGVPDNDILLYLPFHDLIAGDTGVKDTLVFMSFHQTETWLRGNLPEFVATARRLTERGYTFDLVSDKQLTENITVTDGKLTATGGATYRVILVAGCHHLPPETLERLAALARAGATILFENDVPSDVPGLHDQDKRRTRLSAARAALPTNHVATGKPAETLLVAASVPRETLADHGLEFCRRRLPDGSHLYFIANPGTKDVDTTFPLTRNAGTPVLLYDPMTETRGHAEAPGNEVRLQLHAGSSVLLKTTSDADVALWSYGHANGHAIPLAGPWEVTFLEGGPTLPLPRRTLTLTSWTAWDDPELTAFSGTARYTHIFDLPADSPGDWILELGEVCHSARVRLNGQEIGVVLARPWHIALPTNTLHPTGNVLEIEVTNLMANRLADLERRKSTAWRPFLMVDIRYKNFDPAHWPAVPSGLLGPVRLVSR